MSHKPKPYRITYGPAYSQFGELYLPGGETSKGPYPVVILIHGGYWRARYDLSLMSDLAQDLAARGYAAWNIEYRRVGEEGGGWPGTFLDVASAADSLREITSNYSLDMQRVVAIGHSAGGHLAFWLAGRHRIPADSPIGPHATGQKPIELRGVISQAGVLDLEAAWERHLSNDAVVGLLGAPFPNAPERYHAASPAAMLPLGTPQLLLHGTGDANVPIEISRTYARAAQAAHDPVEYIELDGLDHFDLIDPRSSAWATTVEKLDPLLA
jgi:acetyl esterase/lipase